MKEKPLVVVTGGSRGIGKAIVNLFLDKGFRVIAGGTKKSSFETLQKEFTSDDLICISADFSNSAEVIQFSKDVLKIGIPQVLVNNAGIFTPDTFLDGEIETMEKLLQVNFISTYILTKNIVPAMVEKQEGHVFNICSVAGLKAYPNGNSYSISKFALNGFSKVLREELKDKGIKVTTIYPGAVITDSWAGVEIPEERFIKPEDIAHSVWMAYSLSDRSVVEEIVLRPQLGDI